MARVLLFAAAAEAAGRRQADVSATTVGEALTSLTESSPPLARILSICSILVGDTVIARDAWSTTRISADQEIAVLPPVSGGAPTSETDSESDPDSAGTHVSMVDVADKEETLREATAVCHLIGQAEVIARILTGSLIKGDAIAAAKVAGTLAAKKTPELIPLCHPVRTTFAGVEISLAGEGIIEIRAIVRGRDRTGFEMEALVACSVAALTLYDMSKSEDPRMRVEGLRIVAKSGGKSGSVTYP